jgi:hypothetical protein
VRDDNNPPIPRLEGQHERIQPLPSSVRKVIHNILSKSPHLYIQVIRRLINVAISKSRQYKHYKLTNLVEQQYVGLLQRQERKRNTGLLTSTQRPNHLQPSHPTNLEIAKVLPIILLAFTWKLGCQKLYGRHSGNQGVNMVLREVPAILFIASSLTICQEHEMNILTRAVVRSCSRIPPAVEVLP